MTQDEGKEFVVAGLFTSLALILPFVFHAAGLGKIFLPMFLPIAVLGFLVSWRIAASAGAMVPILSAVLTGMPPFYPPIALLMCLEAAFIGACISLLYRKANLPWYACLAIAGIGDRSIAAAGFFIFAEILNLKGTAFSITGIIIGLPGIALQFLFVPLFLKLFETKYGFSPKKG